MRSPVGERIHTAIGPAWHLGFSVPFYVIDEAGLCRINIPIRAGFKGKQSVSNFVAALRTLARTCDFGDITDSLIRDQLVRCNNSKHVQEKLLTKNPDLKEAAAIADGMESTNNWIREMNDHKGNS
ncbi:hypothetical protein NDU88_000262 [Pleurodeles waltl]|uniref:Uncharacterized protein n=1 Tax=Pleurodeles waltl TaxID=8319 RepID=A0AAV7VVJ3_PLEWA|nr:hypothetical protein NDU88_000262 [Pleurodeles waltl]